MYIINSEYITFSWSEEVIIEDVINRSLNYSKLMPSKDGEDNIEKFALSVDDTQFILQQLENAIMEIHNSILRFTYGVNDALKVNVANYIGFKVVNNAFPLTSNFDNKNKIELLDSFIEEFLVVSIVDKWAVDSGLDTISKDVKQNVDSLMEKILKLVVVFSKKPVSKSYLINEI